VSFTTRSSAPFCPNGPDSSSNRVQFRAPIGSHFNSLCQRHLAKMMTHGLPRIPVPSLNYLTSELCWEAKEDVRVNLHIRSSRVLAKHLFSKNKPQFACTKQLGRASTISGNDAEAPPAREISRRSLVVGGALSLNVAGLLLLLAPDQRASAAEPPTTGDFQTAGPSADILWNVYTSDERTPGRAYTLKWPAGWNQNKLSPQGRSFGVDCSFYNPNDRAITLAVFTKPAPGERSIESQGSIGAVAERIANAAPGQKNVGQLRRSMALGDSEEVKVYQVETEVGGGTAGRFGSAVEILAMFLIDEQEYTVRATSGGGRWVEVRDQLQEVVQSFRFS